MGVRHPMNQACFEKASLSNDLNFLKSKRGVSSTQKDWEDDHPLPGSRGKITIIVEQPVRVNLKLKKIPYVLIKRCCIISKECGKMLMPQKKPYCTIWSEGAAKTIMQNGNWAVPRPGIQGTSTLTSPQHGRSCSGWGLTEVSEHLSSLDVQRNTATCRKLLKGLDYFLKEIMFSKHTAQCNHSVESQMSQWIQLQDSVALYLQ